MGIFSDPGQNIEKMVFKKLALIEKNNWYFSTALSYIQVSILKNECYTLAFSSILSKFYRDLGLQVR
jgi:hypothetical protein